MLARTLGVAVSLVGIAAALAVDPPAGNDRNGVGAAPRVEAMRVPGEGIQPQVAVGEGGVVHLVCFSGDPKAGDLLYRRSTDGGASWSAPIRVNSEPGSAVAVGNIRGAHVAVGRRGRVHVAWMGSQQAAEGGASPMLYARLNDAADAFEPQRNLLTISGTLDGGGSIAADDRGGVYVAWHGQPAEVKEHSERARRIWLTRSADDGKTFAPERAIDEPSLGACACCGMRIAADADGRLAVVYRTVGDGEQRDMRLLASRDGDRFTPTVVDRWPVRACPMSSSTIVVGEKRTLVATETQGRVHATSIADGKAVGELVPPGDRTDRKHPAIAVDAAGRVCLAWTEGMGWNKGGAVAWQVFDAAGKPIKGAAGRRSGVPVWSLVAVFTAADGRFVVLY